MGSNLVKHCGTTKLIIAHFPGSSLINSRKVDIKRKKSNEYGTLKELRSLERHRVDTAMIRHAVIIMCLVFSCQYQSD